MPLYSRLIPVGARHAYAELLDALGDVQPPCSQAPELWTSDLPDIEAAAFGCARCHATAACDVYGEALGEQHGVYAGRDRGEQARLQRGEAQRRYKAQRAG